MVPASKVATVGLMRDFSIISVWNRPENFPTAHQRQVSALIESEERNESRGKTDICRGSRKNHAIACGQPVKIVNDPIYGFIRLPSERVFLLIEHPYFQRLRRIRQLGMTHLVYPGALHTRFHHALGAMHLMGEAVEVLRSKGISLRQRRRRLSPSRYCSTISGTVRFHMRSKTASFRGSGMRNCPPCSWIA